MYTLLIIEFDGEIFDASSRIFCNVIIKDENVQWFIDVIKHLEIIFNNGPSPIIPTLIHYNMINKGSMENAFPLDKEVYDKNKNFLEGIGFRILQDLGEAGDYECYLDINFIESNGLFWIPSNNLSFPNLSYKIVNI